MARPPRTPKWMTDGMKVLVNGIPLDRASGVTVTQSERGVVTIKGKGGMMGATTIRARVKQQPGSQDVLSTRECNAYVNDVLNCAIRPYKGLRMSADVATSVARTVGAAVDVCIRALQDAGYDVAPEDGYALEVAKRCITALDNYAKDLEEQSRPREADRDSPFDRGVQAADHCGRCGSRELEYEHRPERDGMVGHVRMRCKLCGHFTVRLGSQTVRGTLQLGGPDVATAKHPPQHAYAKTVKVPGA